jgi:hypothetical protein
MYITIQFKTIRFACTILFVLLVCFIVSASSVFQQEKPNPQTSSTSHTIRNTSSQRIRQSSVQLSLPFGTGPDQKSLNYVHCGQEFHQNTYSDSTDFEIILLHGAKYSKDDWVTSGILNDLCLQGGKHISVTAVDLSVRADGDGFRDAFDALVQSGVLCGKPVVVVSPSASGKAMVSLAVHASGRGDISDLKHMIRAWIPVASPSVLALKDSSVLGSYSKAAVPILAIHGDQDGMGRKVSSTLVREANAKSLELKGGHAVYLDSPRDFVRVILSFINADMLYD